MKTRTTNAVRVLGALMLCAGLLLCGCYDDSALRDQLNDYGEQLSDHESRLKELERLCFQANTNIEALQTIVSALQDKDYVTGVAPIKEGDEVLGYSITFSKSGTVTIYYGKDGYVPSLGVKQEGDQWYWTLDGEWLTDADGNKVRASAKDGKDGQDGKPGVDGVEGTAGVTPTLKIEGGYWYVSFDGGKTWESDSLGQATGDKGDSMFEAVTYDEAYVYITMSDGQQLTLPRTSTSQGGGDDEGAGEFSITFDDYDIGVAPGSSASVAYTITGATDKTTVKAMGQNGWRAEVIQDGTNKGKIKVTAPDPITDDEIIVLVYDGEYRTIMSSVNFVTGVITSSQTAYEVPAEAGTVDVEITTNYNYSLKIPETAQSWLTLVKTKSIKTDLFTFSYAANNGNLRQATVVVEDESGNEISQFVIIQKKYIIESSDEAIDLGATETANCYIVSEEGWYKFNASVKGNSLEKLDGIVSADVVWESFGTAEVPNVGDLIQSIVLSGDYVYFRTPNLLKEGNALIAVRDNDNTILWSWHIWLTDQPQGQEYYNNAGTMMDRNLGATSATPGDVGALGLLYQWGRKDPFLGSSSISNDIEAKSTINWPSAVSSDSSTGTIAYATAHPTTFIKQNSLNYDWYYTGDDSTDDTLWTTSESPKSIYDPCPSGWRVPDGGDDGVWSKACGSSLYFSGYPYDSTNEGMNFSGKFGSASSIWYPASGYHARSGGSLFNVGYCGSYWSASPYSYGADSLYFSNSGSVSPWYYDSRAFGQSVRCLQESK